jgi:4-hydroxy-tetrahydrodipicolinate synthase
VISPPAAAAFHGIYPMLYAFWDGDGRLDRDAMQRQVDYCVAAGAHGLAVLGLVSEGHKMVTRERLSLVEMVARILDGRLPYAVTVCEADEPGQLAFGHAAIEAGASWLILQPPAHPGMGEAELVAFFGLVADALDVPIAVQNNPVNLSVSLSPDALVGLHRNHPNIGLLKGEGFSVEIAQVIEQTGGTLRVFGGHGGIEFPGLLRSGGAGLIPAPDFLMPQIKIYQLWRTGAPEAIAEAERIHRAILPAVVFMSRSVPGMLCYGKRLLASQIGISAIHDRMPALAPTAFGLSETARFAEEIAAALN